MENPVPQVVAFNPNDIPVDDLLARAYHIHGNNPDGSWSLRLCWSIAALAHYGALEEEKLEVVYEALLAYHQSVLEDPEQRTYSRATFDSMPVLQGATPAYLLFRMLGNPTPFKEVVLEAILDYYGGNLSAAELEHAYGIFEQENEEEIAFMDNMPLNDGSGVAEMAQTDDDEESDED